MIYTVNLTIVDLSGIVLVIFLLGLLVGHKYLPRPIDTEKEEMIGQLFNENLQLKLQAMEGKEGKSNGSV